MFKDLLQKIAVEELAKLPYQGLFWEIEKRRFLGDDQLMGILPAFLETEEERIKKMPFIPQYFELSFGFSGDFPADPNSISTPVTLQNEAGQLRLQGRIDRVDVDENGHAVIIDYKTGQVGNNLIQEVLAGKMLQISLYLSVLPEILPEVEPVFGGLYSLKDPAKIKLTAVLADKNCATLPNGRGQAYLPNDKVTDEEDDHPISFVYDSALAARNGQLSYPSVLRGTPVRLDKLGQLQCTSCHDAHDNQYGKFLVMDNSFSALCTTCHSMDYWPLSSHRSSMANWNHGNPDPWPHTPYNNVAANGCENCHRPHSAGGRERLMNYDIEEDNCFACHNGNVASLNIEREFNKPSRHPVRQTIGVHDPTEDPLWAPRHVECSDCHNPHAVNPSSAISTAFLLSPF